MSGLPDDALERLARTIEQQAQRRTSPRRRIAHLVVFALWLATTVLVAWALLFG